MLPWFPVCEVCGDGDAGEAVGFNGDGGALVGPVLEERAQPGVSVAGNVDCGCGDEVVPWLC